MGCDIHSHVEVRNDKGVWEDYQEKVFPEWDRLTTEPFGWRSYGMFGFLADVRNYSQVPQNFGEQPRGIPDDSPYSRNNAKHTEYGFGGYPYDVYDTPWDGDTHSHSYITLRELVDFNFDQTFEDLRVTRQITPNYRDGGCTGEPGEGEMTTYREFLGAGFFEHIEILKTFGAIDDVRVVFWFDN